MKKFKKILIFGIIFLLASCGTSQSGNSSVEEYPILIEMGESVTFNDNIVLTFKNVYMDDCLFLDKIPIVFELDFTNNSNETFEMGTWTFNFALQTESGIEYDSSNTYCNAKSFENKKLLKGYTTDNNVIFMVEDFSDAVGKLKFIIYDSSGVNEQVNLNTEIDFSD